MEKTGKADAKDGKLFDTEALNDGMVVFCDGLTKILSVLSNAAVEANKIGQSLMAMATGANASIAAAGEVSAMPMVTEPDRKNPDASGSMKATLADKSAPTEKVLGKKTAGEAKPAPQVQPSAEEKPDSDGKQFEAVQPDQTAPIPNLTLDDITKVIVKKIKQNRKNNETIGQLVKAYGYSQVREIPKEKYEAFLNDLAQL